MTNPLAYTDLNNFSPPLVVPRVFPNGFIKQVALNSTAITVASGVYSDLTTISLTPGLWSIASMTYVQTTNVNAFSSFSMRAGASTSTGNGFNDALSNGNYAEVVGASTVSVTTNIGTATVTVANTFMHGITLVTSDYWVLVTSAPTNCYLKFSGIFANGTAIVSSPTINVNVWSISARRLDNLVGGS